MNAAELQKIEHWPEILGAATVAWAINTNRISRADVDKAFAEGPQPTGELTEITDEHVAFTINILGSKYPVEFQMSVAEAVLKHHFTSQEQTK